MIVVGERDFLKNQTARRTGLLSSAGKDRHFDVTTRPQALTEYVSVINDILVHRPQHDPSIRPGSRIDKDTRQGPSSFSDRCTANGFGRT
ncbi:unnamed protein product [Nezara viridula]|uniref:Uncharacterized protein n=1 Tax=Nezara viridula TaxID=85310 RepID=A0A9P0HSL5_NEZVI|nr:unnamed protein product [Nezara viridula]